MKDHRVTTDLSGVFLMGDVHDAFMAEFVEKFMVKKPKNSAVQVSCLVKVTCLWGIGPGTFDVKWLCC